MKQAPDKTTKPPYVKIMKSPDNKRSKIIITTKREHTDKEIYFSISVAILKELEDFSLAESAAKIMTNEISKRYRKSYDTEMTVSYEYSN